MTSTDERALVTALQDALDGTPITGVKAMRKTTAQTHEIRFSGAGFDGTVAEVRLLDRPMTANDLAAVAERENEADKPLIVFARRIPASLAVALVSRGIGWVDAAGNARLELDDGRVHVHVTGREPVAPHATEPQRGALREAGYRALFALLADPALADGTVREIGVSSGASRHAVAELLGRLRDDGALIRLGRSGHAWSSGGRQRWIERFVDGWRDVLRGALTLGRFRHPEPDPEAALDRVAAELTAQGAPFGLGGSAGAMRMAPHYRGDDAVIHVMDWHPKLQRQLRLAPSADGQVTAIRCSSELDLRAPAPDTAHPLLIYAELRHSRDPRAAEAAAAIFERHIQDAGE